LSPNYSVLVLIQFNFIFEKFFSFQLDLFSLDSVNQIAFDWASGNWYLLDDTREMILLCSLKPSEDKFLCKTVVSVHVSKPRGIALDPDSGFMFFTVWGSDTAKIERKAVHRCRTT
jgi:hypothetical protein